MEHRLIYCIFYGKRCRQINTTLAHVTEVGVLNFQLPELGVWGVDYIMKAPPTCKLRHGILFQPIRHNISSPGNSSTQLRDLNPHYQDQSGITTDIWNDAGSPAAWTPPAPDP